MSNTPAISSLSRRQVLRLAGLTGAGAALTACAGPGSGAAPEATAPDTSGAVEGEVSFAHWRAEDQGVFDSIIASFAAANPGVTVSQDISPSNDYQSTALQRIRGGDIGDVFTAFRGAQFTDMNSAGLYADLTDLDLVQQYQAELVASGQSDGVQRGLPYQVVFNMPIYNTDLLESAGITEPPADWDSFLAACEALRGAGVIPIAWPGGDAGNAGQLLNSMVMNNAPFEDMFAQIEAGTAKVTDDWFLTTLAQYQQLAPHFQPSATGTAVEPAQQLFATGQAAMLATGSFHILPVRTLGATFPIGALAPITVPAGEARYQGVYNATFVLGVNTASQNQAAALAFLEHLSTPEVAGEYANATVQHVSVAGVEYTNPDLQQLEPWLTANTLLAPRFQFDNLDIRSTVENTAVQVVNGTSPDQAAAEAQAIVDQQVG